FMVVIRRTNHHDFQQIASADPDAFIGFGPCEQHRLRRIGRHTGLRRLFYIGKIWLGALAICGDNNTYGRHRNGGWDRSCGWGSSCGWDSLHLGRRLAGCRDHMKTDNNAENAAEWAIHKTSINGTGPAATSQGRVRSSDAVRAGYGVHNSR